jgi:hypothetical protein
MPANTPVTTPPDTEASALLALHVPSVTVSVSVAVVPVHIADMPLMLPASGAGFMVRI